MKERRNPMSEQFEIPGVENVADMEKGMTLSVLVYGPIGTFKTRFAATFPEPILFFDFDGRLLSTIDLARKKKIDRIPLLEWREGDPLSGEPQAFNYALVQTGRLRELVEKGESCPYKTIVYDSLTTCVERAIDAVKYINQIPHDIPLQRRRDLFNDVYQLVLMLVNQSLAIGEYGVNVIWTAHEEMFKEELMGRIIVRPLFGGDKTRNRVPLRFKEIYHSGVEVGDAGRPAPYLETCATEMVEARSSFKLPSRINPDFEELMAWVEESWKEEGA
jgi:hypothetical protein